MDHPLELYLVTTDHLEECIWFRDEEDFQSGGHLSNPGARKFTDLFVGLMQRRGQGEDVSQEFYTDYQDLYAHMPYAG